MADVVSLSTHGGAQKDGRQPVGPPGAPAGAARIGQKRLAPQQVLSLFEAEKDQLISKYKKKRSAMNSRGVFDEQVNTIRAENMLLAAIGRINIQQLERQRGKRQRVTDLSARGEQAGGRGRKEASAVQTVAAKLQQELNQLHEKGVAAQQECERRHRQRAREDKLRRGLPQTGGQHTASPARRGRQPPGDKGSPQLRNYLRTQSPHPGALRSRQASQLSMESAVSPALRSVGDPSEHDSEGERPRAEVDRSPALPAARLDGDRDDGAVTPPIPASRSIVAQQPAQSHPPREQSPAPRSSDSFLESPVARSTRVRQRMHTPAESASVQFSAAEWMQKHWEHQHYPQVEARVRLRRKLADNAFRPSDAVKRYTERRQWMHVELQHASALRNINAHSGSPELTAAAVRTPLSNLVYVCAVSAHSVFEEPHGDATVTGELKRGDVVQVAEMPTQARPEFRDTSEGTWAKISAPQLGWVLLHDSEGAIYLRQRPPDGWSKQAASLNVERMLHTPSLLEIVDGPLVEAAKTAQRDREKRAGQQQQQQQPQQDAEAVPSPPLDARKSPQHPPKGRQALTTPQSPASPHLSAMAKGEAMRREFVAAARRELNDQRSAVHPEVRLHEVTPQQLWPGDSSDDDDLIQPPDDHAAARSHEAESAAICAQQETLGLLEAVITFLCREYESRRVGCASRSTSVRVVRNLLIQALRSLSPHISRTMANPLDGQPGTSTAASSRTGNAPQAAAGTDTKGADAAPALPADHRILMLRTWLKGVEVLLTWDLELTEPFLLSREDHSTVLARYYCALCRRVHSHCDRLVTRWRDRRAAAEHEAAGAMEARMASGAGEHVQSQRAPRHNGHDAWKAHLAEYLSKHAVVSEANPDAETATRVRGFMERYGFAPSNKQPGVEAAAPPVLSQMSDCPAHQRARSEYRRLFFEKFGFVPSGPSGSGDVPPQDGGRPTAASTSAVQRVRDLLLSDVGILGGRSAEAAEAALRSALQRAREAKLGGVSRGDLFRGAVLPKREVYRACLKHATVPLYQFPRYHHRNQSGRGGGSLQSLRYGEIVVAVATCQGTEAEGEWLYLTGGHWVPRCDPDTGQPWIEPAPQHELALWQHSADSVPLRSAAGGQSEARQRQRVLMLSELLSVLNKYMKICSRAAQQHFLRCTQRERQQSVALDDDARWRRLFDLASGDEGPDGTPAQAGTAAGDRVSERDKRAWEVERDLLLRRYGGRKRKSFRRQRVLEGDQWGLEASAMKSEDQLSAVGDADDEAVKRHQRFTQQRKEKAAEQQAARLAAQGGGGPAARHTLFTCRANAASDLDGNDPPPDFSDAEPEAAKDEGPYMPSQNYDSDGEDLPPIPRGKQARQQLSVKAMAELNTAWQGLRIDVQRKLVLSDKYSRLQTERGDGSDGTSTLTTLLTAERLWRGAEHAVQRRERVLRTLAQRLDPGLPSYEPAFIDDQKEVTAALQQLATHGLEVEQCQQRLATKLGDDLSWDGVACSERLHADYNMVLGLLEQAKAAPALVQGLRAQAQAMS